MYKREKEAYMTVEASLVIPIVLGGIIFILYIGFYLYNFATIKQTAYVAALRGSQIKNVSSAEMENYIEKQIDELMTGQILGKEGIKKDITVSAGKIKVKIYTDIKIPLITWLPFTENIWEIKAESQVNRVEPIEIIRGVRNINGS